MRIPILNANEVHYIPFMDNQFDENREEGWYLSPNVDRTRPKNNSFVLDGRKTADGKPAYLGTVAGLSVDILASPSAPLVLWIHDRVVKIIANIRVAGLVAAPAANNTCLVNDVTMAGTARTTTEGELYRRFAIDTEGAQVIARDGQRHVLSAQPGATREYFLANIDTTNHFLHFCRRSIAGSPRQGLSNNDVLTLRSANYIFIDHLGNTYASAISPDYLPAAPAPGAAGRWYFNTADCHWYRDTGAAWVQMRAAYLGIAICHDTQCIAVSPVDFDLRWDSINESEIYYFSADVLFVKLNRVAVGDVVIDAHWAQMISLAANIIPGEPAEAASTLYYIYVDTDGQCYFSAMAPRLREKLRGYYHPQYYKRCIGFVYNNGASNIEPFIFRGGRYQYINTGGGGADGEEIQNAAGGANFFEYLSIPAIVEQARFAVRATVPAGGGATGVGFIGRDGANEYTCFYASLANDSMLSEVSMPVENKMLTFTAAIPAGGAVTVGVLGFEIVL